MHILNYKGLHYYFNFYSFDINISSPFVLNLSIYGKVSNTPKKVYFAYSNTSNVSESHF